VKKAPLVSLRKLQKKSCAYISEKVVSATNQRAINAELTEQLELRVQQRTKELHEQTDNLHITFNSIGDAMLVTDVYGRITAINPVAEKLTGWHLISDNRFSCANPRPGWKVNRSGTGISGCY
jgi:PAS domain-containing protein